MAINSKETEKVEAYTRALMEAARGAGRENADLVQWQHARKFSPEVLETLAAMQREDDIGLLEEVAKRYKELLDAQDIGQHLRRAVTILDIGALHDQSDHQTERVRNDVTL